MADDHDLNRQWWLRRANGDDGGGAATGPTGKKTGGPSSVLGPGGTGTGSGSSGGGGGGGGSYARAMASMKDQSARENAATNDVIRGILAAMKGQTAGRDKQIKNAATVFDQTMLGIHKQLLGATEETEGYSKRNQQNFDDQSNSNDRDRVRSLNEAAQNVLAQGAGETDVQRALGMALRQSDSNQNDAVTSYKDTLQSLRGNLMGAATTGVNAATNAFMGREEARGGAWADFYKNMLDGWVNIQRTQASNTNVGSDTSVAYKPLYSNKTINKKIGDFAGQVYDTQKPEDAWAETVFGPRAKIEDNSRTGNQAAAVRLGPARKAEGATSRKWDR